MTPHPTNDAAREWQGIALPVSAAPSTYHSSHSGVVWTTKIKDSTGFTLFILEAVSETAAKANSEYLVGLLNSLPRPLPAQEPKAEGRDGMPHVSPEAYAATALVISSKGGDAQCQPMTLVSDAEESTSNPSLHPPTAPSGPSSQGEGKCAGSCLICGESAPFAVWEGKVGVCAACRARATGDSEGAVIHRLTHSEPEGWPDREMMEQAWAEKDEHPTPPVPTQPEAGEECGLPEHLKELFAELKPFTEADAETLRKAGEELWNDPQWLRELMEAHLLQSRALQDENEALRTSLTSALSRADIAEKALQALTDAAGDQSRRLFAVEKELANLKATNQELREQLANQKFDTTP